MGFMGNDLYVGGRFTTAGTATANRIAKWNGSSWSSLGTGTNDLINDLEIVGNELYVGGNFTTAGNLSAKYIARWNGTAWAALGSGLNSQVNTLYWTGSELLVGGYFTTAGGNAANRIAKWNGSSWIALSTNFNGPVKALGLAGGNIFIGGIFSSVENLAPNNIIKKTPTSWETLGRGCSDDIYTIAISGNNVYVGGRFKNIGGIAAAHIAKWNGTTWSALGQYGVGELENDYYTEVRAIVVNGNDVYVGGFITNVNGNAVEAIVKWNGTSWSSLGSGLTNNGSHATVYCLTLIGNDLYAGGDFVTAGGNPANRVAKWNGSSWSALGSGSNSTVSDLVSIGTDLYALGSFTGISGPAKWNGSSWSALGTGVSGGATYDMDVYGTDLYVVGNFTSAGGNPANRVAKWNGSSWSAFGSNYIFNGPIYEITVSDTNVFVGGAFTSIGSLPVNRIARWDGNNWHRLGNGLTNGIFCLAIKNDSLLVGGSFLSAGANQSSNLAIWSPLVFNAVCPSSITNTPPNVIIQNSQCNGSCQSSGGLITAPSSPCPQGGVLAYSLNNGISWSTIVPVYDQNGPVQTIITRCQCLDDDYIHGPTSTPVSTIPAICTSYQCYLDADGDSFGGNTSPVISCNSCNTGYVPNNLDCDDNNNTIFPEAPELCNSIDDNCNNIVDEQMLTTGLLGWYPFNGNAEDETSNPYDGFLVDAILTTDRLNNQNKAYSFNGTTSRINIYSSLPYLNFTISTWVHYSSIPTSYQTIISKNANTNNFQTFAIYWDNNRIKAITSNGIIFTELIDNTTTYNSSPSWIHVALTFDVNLKLSKLYVNGNLVATASTGYFVTGGSYPLVLGARSYANGTYSSFLYGKIDDVRYYNFPLSSQQILNIYNEPQELCNGLDDDCDGVIDDGVKSMYYKDLDNDLYGDPQVSLSACTAPNGYVSNNFDCNDNNNQVNTASVDICNGIDDNCNGVIDEQIFTSGLTASYPFNGNINDESPSANNSNSYYTTFTSDRHNLGNRALQFNGTNAYMTIPLNPSLTSLNKTISLWVYYQSLPYDYKSLLFQRSINFDVGSESYFEIFWDYGKIQVQSHQVSSPDRVTNYQTSNAWVHIAYTYNDTTKLHKLFINGILVIEFCKPQPQFNSFPLIVGAKYYQTNYTSFYNGKIDDIKIYNFAASDQQIQQIHTESQPEVCNGVDDNCNTLVDEGLQTIFYKDLDGDLFGDPSMTFIGCNPPMGYVSNNLDCNDCNPNINPDQIEICSNTVDDNCNGVVNELDLSTRLQAFYPFNGNAIDESQNNNDAVVTNATLTTDRFGNIDKAYQFNGTNSRITISNNASMNSKNLTVSAWVYYSSLPTGEMSIISKKLSDYYATSYKVYWSGGKITAGFADCNNTLTLNSYSTVYPSNGWIHTCITFDNTNKLMKLYINGIQVDSKNTCSSMFFSNNQITIGAYYNGSSYSEFYNGKIDEVRFYNFAATSNQIQHIMNNLPLEICNDIDDDCDGMVDEGVQTTFYQDLDGDTYGNPAVFQLACSAPSGYVNRYLDCNDNNAKIYPGVTEICNGVDDNCNGIVDEKVLTNGLSFWLPFNDNAFDNGPYNVNTTLFNAILSTDRHGISNKAYQFNGTNSYISVAYSYYGLEHLSFTYSTWIYYNSIPTGTKSIITAPYGSNPLLHRHLYWNNGRIKATVSSSYDSYILTDNITNYPANGWLHIAFVFNDVSNIANLYVNGTLVANTTLIFEPILSGNPWIIGAGYNPSNYSYTNFYNGKIDDVRIYNFAATPAQVTQIMNDVLPETCNGIDDDCDGMVDEGLTQTNTFISNSGSTLWSNNVNWSTGQLPTFCDDVIINPGNSVDVDIINAKARSIWVKPNSTLNVLNNKLLEIYGNGIFSTMNEGIINVDGNFKIYKP
jgi:hypothetical protein